MDASHSEPEHWLRAARLGSRSALGDGLEACRNYLLRIAEGELDAAVRAKVGASDLVQQTFMEAQQAFERFTGNNDVEWRVWLRQILRNNLADYVRRWHAGKRDVARETPLAGAGSSAAWPLELAGSQTTPSGVVRNAEEAATMERALAALPADHQEVLRWRHEEDLSFDEIAGRLGRSANAARKFWMRAVLKLQQEFACVHERK